MMAQPPKTPAPPRRKASTGPRKTTRATPPKADGTDMSAGDTSSDAPAPPTAAAKPVRRAPAKRTATRKAPATRATPPPGDTGVAARATTAARAVKTRASSAGKATGDRASKAAGSVASSKPAKLVSDTREKMGDRNFFAAVLGGVAAAGAAVGGLLYARRDKAKPAPAAADEPSEKSEG